MEELFQIIVTTILIIAATAFSQLSKKKRAQQEVHIPEDDNNTHDISSDTLHKASQSHTPTQVCKSPQTKANKPTPASQNSSQIANSAQNNDLNEPIQEEFDLKKAVIYSEILSPKFKEEEF